MDYSMPGLPVYHQLLELAQTHVYWVGDAIQPSHPLSSPSPPAFPIIRVFSNKSTLHIRWPKYYSFSFSISPSNEYSGLIRVRMDWLDLLAIQVTLKSLLQHHSSKACSLRWTKILHRMDWLDLLAIQVTLKSLLQHHSSKACSLWWTKILH